MRHHLIDATAGSGGVRCEDGLNTLPRRRLPRPAATVLGFEIRGDDLSAVQRRPASVVAEAAEMRASACGNSSVPSRCTARHATSPCLAGAGRADGRAGVVVTVGLGGARSAAAGIDTWCGLDVGRPSVCPHVVRCLDVGLSTVAVCRVFRSVVASGKSAAPKTASVRRLAPRAPGRRAIEHAGLEALRSSAGRRQPDGSYRQDTAFRYLVAARERDHPVGRRHRGVHRL
jgi:hypothetical protein